MMLDVARKTTRLVVGEPYYAVRAYRDLVMSQLRRKEPLYVHQMGKVGSSTVVHSLRAVGIDRRMTIYWTHYLTPDGLRFLRSVELQNYGAWSNFPPNVKSHLAKSQAVGKQVRLPHRGKKRKVVTLVRDPIEVRCAGRWITSETCV